MVLPKWKGSIHWCKTIGLCTRENIKFIKLKIEIYELLSSSSYDIILKMNCQGLNLTLNVEDDKDAEFYISMETTNKVAAILYVAMQL